MSGADLVSRAFYCPSRQTSLCAAPMLAQNSVPGQNLRRVPLFGAQRHLSTRQGARCAAVQDRVSPAVLPDTVKDFAIPEQELIALCKKYSQSSAVSVEGATPTDADSSIFAPDFRFEGPIIKLDKKAYLEARKSFGFADGIPNVALNAYDFRVDKYEPQRVWYTVRISGTHSGTFKFLGREVKPTGRTVLQGPECMSMTFNSDGQITSLSGGYVMDNRLGNCNKLGGLFGILHVMGINLPFPQPGTLGWKVGSAVDTGVNFSRQALHFLTFGVFREKPKVA